MTNLPAQAAHEAAIELELGIVQHQRRLTEPGDNTPSQNVRLPGNRIARAVYGNPLVDQGAGICTRDGGLRSAQMSKPAEAEKSDGPILGGRGHLERRARIAN